MKGYDSMDTKLPRLHPGAPDMGLKFHLPSTRWICLGTGSNEGCRLQTLLSTQVKKFGVGLLYIMQV